MQQHLSYLEFRLIHGFYNLEHSNGTRFPEVLKQLHKIRALKLICFNCGRGTQSEPIHLTLYTF